MESHDRKGNKLFFLNNSYFTISPCYAPLFSFLTVMSLPILFLVFSSLSPSVLLIFLSFFLLMIMLYFVLFLSDPGILKFPSDPLSPPQAEPAIQLKPFSLRGSNAKLSFLYCRVCDAILPNRAFHCGYCNVCVDHYESHSFIVNNCIGKRNRGTFLFFLVTAFITNSMIAVIALQSLVGLKELQWIAMAVSSTFSATFYLVMAALQLWTLGTLQTRALMSNIVFEPVEATRRGFFTNLWRGIRSADDSLDDTDDQTFGVVLK